MLLGINISKRILIISLVIIMLLGACKTSLTDNTLPTINLTDVNSTAQSAAATLLAETMAPTLTATVIPTNTHMPANTPRLTPTPLSFRILQGLRAVYGSGNLYIQDSGKPEFQLTHSGHDYNPVLSDDGQKVVFEHGMEIHAINADGTGERALITADILAALGHGYNEFTRRNDLAFVPSTHQLLFSTSRANPDNPNERATPNYDLFVVDTDAGGIKQLLAPGQVDNLYIHYGWEGKFAVSPNGNLVALQMPDHIQVINIQGQVVQQALVTYPADEAHSVIPMYWTKDSSELTILPSEIPLMSAEPIVRTVWRYRMDDSAGIKIPLTPPPLYDDYAVSPDGNWIVYGYSPYSIPDDMPLVAPVGVYLGNLHDGTSQLIDDIKLPDATSSSFTWGPDSLHFIFADDWNTYIGNLLGQMTPLGRGSLPSWIDNNHYLYGGGDVGEVGKVDRVLVLDLFPPAIQNDDFEPPVFVYLGN
jgi:hypothetical protein